jgi:hypothetical protein
VCYHFSYLPPGEAKSAISEGEDRGSEGHECARCKAIQSSHQLVYRSAGVEREERSREGRGEQGKGGRE